MAHLKVSLLGPDAAWFMMPRTTIVPRTNMTRKRIEQIIAWLKELLPKPKPAPAPVPKPKRFTMYDSIEVSTIPKSAAAVAGYVGGKWPTYGQLVGKFPNAKKLSIAVFAKEDADCLDVENGDATPGQVGAWVKRQKKRGVPRPVIYASLDAMPAIKFALAQAKINRVEVKLWVAHYTYTPHIEPGYDATQYTDKALGRNLDASLCLPNFL